MAGAIEAMRAYRAHLVRAGRLIEARAVAGCIALAMAKPKPAADQIAVVSCRAKVHGL